MQPHGLIKRIDAENPSDEHWEVTSAGEAELLFHARFLKRDGLDCPPKD